MIVKLNKSKTRLKNLYKKAFRSKQEIKKTNMYFENKRELLQDIK